MQHQQTGYCLASLSTVTEIWSNDGGRLVLSVINYVPNTALTEAVMPLRTLGKHSECIRRYLS